MTIVKRSLADQVADQVTELIIGDGLGPGDAVPSTSALAQRFGVSIAVVREAQALLIGRGIISSAQGRESVVLTPGAVDLGRLLSFRLRQEESTLEELMDVRVGLESIAAARAAQRATSEDLARIRGSLKARDEVDSIAEFHRHDVAFHREIAVTSGNALIVMVLDALSDLLVDFRTRATEARLARGEDRDLATVEHYSVLDAIEARDSDAAAAAMKAHLESSRREIS